MTLEYGFLDHPLGLRASWRPTPTYSLSLVASLVAVDLLSAALIGTLPLSRACLAMALAVDPLKSLRNI